MPVKTIGEDAAKRRRAERSGNLDKYLEEMGAGDDTLRQGFRRIDAPKKETRNGERRDQD